MKQEISLIELDQQIFHHEMVELKELNRDDEIKAEVSLGARNCRFNSTVGFMSRLYTYIRAPQEIQRVFPRN